ncbi:MAG: hypothetical protein QXU18_12840 [Thermoplasmatales archaeon]
MRNVYTLKVVYVLETCILGSEVCFTSKVGVVEIKDIKYDKIRAELKEFLAEHSPSKVDENKKYVTWYEEGKENNGKISIIRYFTFDFWARRVSESIDHLTHEVTKNISSTVRKICITEVSNKDKSIGLFIIADQGTSNVIAEISSLLNLDVSMRRRLSFNEDFIEFLNTSTPGDKHYNIIFDRDMESTSRKARKGKHRIDEGYLDLSLRELGIHEQFREAAGVRIVAPSTLGNLLPTIDVLLYNNGWLNVRRPRIEDDEATYYEAVLYGVARLTVAYNSFLAI